LDQCKSKLAWSKLRKCQSVIFSNEIRVELDNKVVYIWRKLVEH